MATDLSVFDSTLGGWKTYITAALGILYNALAAFGVWNPSAEQVTAVNGVGVLAAVIFLRMGIRKAQASAAKAAVASASAEKTVAQAGAQAMAQRSRL